MLNLWSSQAMVIEKRCFAIFPSDLVELLVFFCEQSIFCHHWVICLYEIEWRLVLQPLVCISHSRSK
jgi:hypothetical protein